MNNEKTWKVLNLLWPLVVLLVLASVVYTVLTGEGLGTNVHYNTLGRIITGLGGVIFVGFCIWSYRANKRLDKRLAERQQGSEEP